MSQEIVPEVLQRLGTEPEFRRRMSQDSVATLDNDYPDKLTDAEKTTLKEMAGGFASDLREAERPWWQPSSFKELGGAVLSVGLLVLLFWVLDQTYRQIATPPVPIKFDGTIQILDVFDRAKNLLNTLFPLFAAVVTFWLGVAIEGKRADENKKTADKESQNRANSEARERTTKANAAATIGTAKGQVMALRDTRRTQTSGPDVAVLDSLMTTLEEGERAVLR